MTGHANPQRPEETFEPYENFRPIPLPVLMIAVALAIWGGVLLFDNSEAVSVGQVERADQLADMPARGDTSGAALFAARCGTCHQSNGSGVRDAVPPLAASPFLTATPDVATNILLHGIDGPIRVGDTVYNGHMPNFSSVLSDAEIARLVTHVRATFVGKRDPVSEHRVASIREAGRGRGPWQGGHEIAVRLSSEVGVQPMYIAAPAAGPANAEIMRLVSQGRSGVWACASCHGAQGQGAETVPRLAGLPEAYIAKQLSDYVSGARRNETMAMVAGALTASERNALGLYYSQLRAPSTAHPGLGGDIDRGEQLVLEGDWNRNIPACTSCHGPSSFGVAPEFPALAAQHPAYTAGQLTAWISGERDNARQKLMNGIAKALTDGDRRAVADYLATLPPIPAAPRAKEKTDVRQ